MFCNLIGRLFIIVILLSVQGHSQDNDSFANSELNKTMSSADRVSRDALLTIIDGTFELYQFLRNDIGVYADAARFEGGQFHPCSIASVGMGLVSLCIADTLNLVDNAEELILQSLNAMAGNVAGFTPARNPVNGFYRHWIDMESGARAWNSEYSSIDTGILVSGALFCKMYFPDNEEIAHLADSIYLSVDWNAAMANFTGGEIYMTFDEQGRGELKTRPFNEYMIVAWLANNDPRANLRTTELWKKHYEKAASLPNSSYNGIDLLTDSPGRFLSNFVFQFPWYLCHHFTARSDYVTFYKNANQADRQWWADKTDAPVYVWGTGAGASNFVDSGYHADNFNDNPGTVCSPHVLAGFSPVDSLAAVDVINLWNQNIGVYRVPGSTKKILWRFSVQDPSWRAKDVQGVDISTLLFGLAAAQSILGKDFFVILNDFDFPTQTDVKKKSDSHRLKYELDVKAWPNPFNGRTTLHYELAVPSLVKIDLFDVRGRFIKTLVIREQNIGKHAYHFDASTFSSGLYVVRLKADHTSAIQRVLLLK